LSTRTAANRLPRARFLLAVLSIVSLVGCDRQDGNIEAVDVRTAVYAIGQGRMLVVESDRGRIEIEGEADRTDIEVTTTIRARGASLERAQERIDALDLSKTQTEDALYLAFHVPEKGTAWRASADFVVLVPVRTSLDVIGDAVDVTIKNVTGTIRVDTQDGRVEGRRLTGEIHVVTALGLPGNGDVVLDELSGPVMIETESGDPTIHSISGVLDVTTGSGDIVVRGADLDRFTVESKTGDVEFSGRLAEDGTIHEVSTHRGDIHLRIPIDSRLRVEAEVSIGGSIASALPLAGDTEGREWLAILNAPDGTLHLKTLDGQILIGRLHET
jgi:hypothetical protein